MLSPFCAVTADATLTDHSALELQHQASFASPLLLLIFAFFLLLLSICMGLHDAGENGKALPARTGHSCTVLPENRLLIFGGMDDAGKYKNDMFLIDVKRLTWFKMPAKGAPPKGRAYHSWVPR